MSPTAIHSSQTQRTKAQIPILNETKTPDKGPKFRMVLVVVLFWLKKS